MKNSTQSLNIKLMSLCTTNYMKNTKKKRDSNYEKLTYLCVEKSITIIQDKNILKIIEIY